MSESQYAKKRTNNPEDVEDLGSLPPGLTPARSAGQNPLEKLASRKPASTPRQKPAPAPKQPEKKTTTEPSLAGRAPRTKGSTMRLTDQTCAKVEARRAATGHSGGQIVIEAIEHCYMNLAALVAANSPEPKRTAAGFRSGQGPNHLSTRVFAFRLTQDDYDNVDRIVKQMGATSRTHLVQTALDAFFEDLET